MALPLNNTFETGIASGTAITVANSDDGNAGNAFDQVGLGGASTAVYDSARAAHGTLSGKFSQDTTQDVYVRWSTSVGPQAQTWGRFYMYRTAAPTGNQWFLRPQNAGTDACLAQWLAAGQLRLFDSTLGASQTSTASIPVNQWVRFEWRLLCSATVGVWEVKFFSGDSLTATETVTFSSANTLTQITEVQFGQTTNIAIGTDFWFDDMNMNNTGYVGPWPGPAMAWVTA